MVADQIDQLKQQYTDKYVVVDGTQPELARFRDVVGRVKTVNMSGRALVEFDDYHVNIGWYDIDPAFLKVVDKPAPKPKAPAEKKPAAKPPGEAASAAGQKTPPPKAAPAKPAGGKPSTADILAAARGAKTTPAKPPTPGEPASAGGPTKPAPSPTAAPAKVDRAKMSVADMLAAARAQGAGSTAPTAKPPAETAPVAEPPIEEEASEEVAPAPAAKQPSSEKVDRKTMSVNEKIAWCRQHDAK